MPRAAEATQKRVDRLIGADANEEVRWRERPGGVSIGIAELAEKLLEVVLVGVRIAVQAQEVN